MNLCRIDVLPPQSGVHIELDDSHHFVRFRGYDPVRMSEWSGWFDVADCPIHLTWAAFEWGVDEAS